MIQKSSQDNAVSPVVGVILMVAVTVILAAVIGNFVLNLGSSVSEPPQASLSLSQDYNFNDNNYTVRVGVTQMTNADFLHATVAGKLNKDNTVTIANISNDGVTTGTADVPVEAEADETSDAPVVEGLSAGDTVQVIGVLEGEEQVLQTYEVSNTQG